MCNRLVLKDSIDQLKTNLHLHFPPQIPLTLNYNIAPGNNVPVIHSLDKKIKLSEMIWGLYTSYSEVPLSSIPSETAEKNLVTHDLIIENKCLVPVSGFYEWDKRDTPPQPYYFYLPGTPLLTLAGVWIASVVDLQKVLYRFIILTKKAPPETQEINSRIPVIVPADKHKQWLEDPDFNIKDLVDNPPLHYYKVSTYVNDPSKNDLSLISPLI